MIKGLLAYVEPKMLMFLGIAIIGLTLTGAYLYLFKESLQSYVAWHDKLARLQRDFTSTLTLDSDIQNLRNEIVKLDSASESATSDASFSEMIAIVIGQLDQIAQQHSVMLLGVRPGSYTPVYMFDEMPFYVEVMGSYRSLFNWLYEIDNRLGSLVVKRFEIEPGASQAERHMRLTIVSYHLQERI